MTDLPPPTGPSPGWYPDPTPGGRGFRWWDGVGWTAQWSEAPDAGHEGLTPVGEWMSELLKVMRSRAGHFFTLIVLLIVPTTLINGISAWYAFHDLIVTSNSETGEIGVVNAEANAALYAAAVATFVVLIVAGVALVVATVRQTQAVLGEQVELWSDSLREGVRRLPRASAFTGVILAILIGLYLTVVISAVAAPVALLFTFPVWIIGTLWFSARFSLTNVAVMLAPAGNSALRTSWNLTKTHSWPLLGRMAMLMFFSVSLTLLMRIVASPFIAIVGGAGTTPPETDSGELRIADLLGDNPAVFAIGQLFGALGNGIAVVMWAVGFVLVYRDLSGPVEAPNEVEVSNE